MMRKFLFEENKPDNERVNVVNVVQKFIGDVINPWLLSGLDPTKDPRRIDVIAEAKRRIIEEIQQGRLGITHGQREIEAVEDLARRFGSRKKADGFVARHLRDRVAAAREHIAHIERVIAVNEEALKLLGDMWFRFDPPESAITQTGQAGIPGMMFIRVG
jgi:hypothetical protein